jgi:hypothetical protein
MGEIMDIRKLFGSNKAKESEGAWVPIGGGIEVKVKRAGQANKEFAAEQMKMLKPFSKQIAMNTMDMDVLRQINAKLFAKHIIVDWKGVSEAGKPVKFSKEKFLEYANEMPDFFSDIFAAATELQNFQDAEDAEAEKKPVSSTATD